MRTGRRSLGEDGQTTVEFALLLPLVVVLLAGLGEAGLLFADNLRVMAAAREGARAAAVTSDEDAIREAAELSGLEDLTIETSPAPAERVQGGTVTTRVTFQPQGHIPLVGSLSRSLELTATARMRIERP